MKEFNKFYFKSFEFDLKSFKASFYYNFDNEVIFEENIDFSSDFKVRKNIDLDVLNNILFHIHIALGISYYKAYPTKDLIVESGFLDEYQIEFWKKFYINGLGEFLYTNKISPKGLFNFVNSSKIKYEKIDFQISDKALVPVGGGKDSIVSIELLKKGGIDFDLFTFSVKDNLLYENTSKVSGISRLRVKRIFGNDSLKKLNDSGNYNGHVPITGLIAFVMQAVGYLYNYKYFVLSNERSANFGNTKWEGVEINHQYSKSLDFERDFAEYVEKYISSDLKYFSLLRGMYEVKIAELFAKYAPKYFSSFSSCNYNFKIFSDEKIDQESGTYWCNNCPKCVFVFSILSPYLKNDEIIQIFGEDLFERKDLELLFRELLGITGIKPFECVGEAEEVIYSMYKSLDKYKNKIPYILEIFKNEVLIKFSEKDLANIEKKLGNMATQDIIPKEIKKIIFK